MVGGLAFPEDKDCKEARITPPFPLDINFAGHQHKGRLEKHGKDRHQP